MSMVGKSTGRNGEVLPKISADYQLAKNLSYEVPKIRQNL